MKQKELLEKVGDIVSVSAWNPSLAEIQTEYSRILVHHNSIIAIILIENGCSKLYLNEDKYHYSTTASKYLNKFLEVSNENFKRGLNLGIVNGMEVRYFNE